MKTIIFLLIFFPSYSRAVDPALHIGNDTRYINSIEPLSEAINKKILFLGSSVTRGSASLGISFADMLQKKYKFDMIKDAIDGSTLVDKGENSYISRLKKYKKNDNIDLLVVQLSTNDSYQNFPIYSDNGSDSIESAVLYIINYAKNTLECPVVFFTSPPPLNNIKYQEMVILLNTLAAKNKVHVIDFFHCKSLTLPPNGSTNCICLIIFIRLRQVIFLGFRILKIT